MNKPDEYWMEVGITKTSFFASDVSGLENIYSISFITEYKVEEVGGLDLPVLQKLYRLLEKMIRSEEKYLKAIGDCPEVLIFGED